MATKILNWKPGTKRLVKILITFLFCLVCCAIPLLVQKSVLNAFSVPVGAKIAANVIANVFFQIMFLWFAIPLFVQFLINMIFHLIEDVKADMVTSRRTLQIILNAVIIIGGVAFGYYLVLGYFISQDWWSLVILSVGFLKNLLWLPQLLFAVAATLQMILGIWFFGPSNKNPWIAQILRNIARDKKQV